MVDRGVRSEIVEEGEGGWLIYGARAQALQMESGSLLVVWGEVIGSEAKVKDRALGS